MIDKSELRRVPAFADLPDDQIVWFISQSEEMHLRRVILMSGQVIQRMRCS